MNRGVGAVALGVLCALVGLVSGACDGFTPQAGGEDVGSNTNWLVRCSRDAECGGQLSCICGSCSRFCSGEDDCEPGSRCPMGQGAFQLACPDEVVAGVERSCRALCETDEDCGAGGICLDEACVHPDVEACAGVAELVWDSEPGELQARVGSLFGMGFYVPEQPAILASDAAYLPTELTVIAVDEAGEPVSGCEVVLVSEEASGFAFSPDAMTDATGRVSFVWVAGTAAEQTMSARVLSQSDEWISVKASGEARRHDEEPLSVEAEPVATTRVTAVGLSYPSAPSMGSVQVRFTPLTFPASSIYGAVTTSGLEIWLINGGGAVDAVSELSEVQRLGFFRAQGTDVLSARALFSSDLDDCSSDGMDVVCREPGAWALGVESVWRIEAHRVAVGEVVSDYEFGDPPPCDGAEGCTDYSIFRVGPGSEPELRAVLRSPIVDDLGERGAFIDVDFSDQSAHASSCLLTEQASFLVVHEEQTSGQWASMTNAQLGASPFGFRGEVCANYAAFAREGSYYLSTGGPSAVSTPHLPGATLQLD